MIIPLEWMPPLMFAGLVVFMIIGYPVAFSLAAVGFFFGFMSIEIGYFTMPSCRPFPGRVFGIILSNELLLAIPFFTFMGAILEKCGLAEDMLESMGQLFGPVKGGLGYSTIIVGFILGAITGTVAAQVIAMALITLPVMMRYKYDMRYATGVLAASGTITQLVPPSLVLVVLADQLGRSVGDMYLGAWGPSLLQIALFAAYTFYRRPGAARGAAAGAAHAVRQGAADQVRLGHHPGRGADLPGARHHHDGPGDADRGRRHGHHRRHRAGRGAQRAAHQVRQMDVRRRLRRRRRRLADRHGRLQVDRPSRSPSPSCSPSIIWLCWRAWQFKELRDLIVQAFQATMRITAMVAFILVGATCFSITFQGVDGNRWVEHLMSNLPGGVWGFLIVVNLFVFFLAFFLDFFEIAFIIMPMLAPVAQKILDAGGRRRRGADLVRRHALRQRADLVHASAVRLRAVLPAQRGAQGSEELGHLLGLGALGVPAAHHGGDRDRLPAVGDLLPRQAVATSIRARSRSRSRRRPARTPPPPVFK